MFTVFFESIHTLKYNRLEFRFSDFARSSSVPRPNFGSRNFLLPNSVIPPHSLIIISRAIAKGVKRQIVFVKSMFLNMEFRAQGFLSAWSLASLLLSSNGSKQLRHMKVGV